MMNDAEIQIQFPKPGTWQEFTLTPIYQDKGGYRPPARYTQDEIPAEQAPAMQAVVAALVGLAEPQQAHSELDPCPPRIQYRTACTSS